MLCKILAIFFFCGMKILINGVRKFFMYFTVFMVKWFYYLKEKTIEIQSNLAVRESLSLITPIVVSTKNINDQCFLKKEPLHSRSILDKDLLSLSLTVRQKKHQKLIKFRNVFLRLKKIKTPQRLWLVFVHCYYNQFIFHSLVNTGRSIVLLSKKV